MNNNDERDYAEEEYNKGLLRNPDDLDKPIYSDEERESNTWWNFGHSTRDWGVISESAQEVEDRLPVGYGDSWDGSSTNQSNHFFIGHNGYVTTMWQVTNNPHEKYDSSKSYHLPARDGSALYVWFNMKMDDQAALSSIEDTSKLLHQMDTNISGIRFIS